MNIYTKIVWICEVQEYHKLEFNSATVTNMIKNECFYIHWEKKLFNLHKILKETNVCARESVCISTGNEVVH